MPAEEGGESPYRFTIRTYQPGDERAILALFSRAFHVQRTLEEWSWKFERDPWGTRRISLAFDPEGALVAQYAAYPVRFHHAERGLLSAQQVGDTMTDVAVRNVGRGPSSVLARTARHFYERFCEGHVAFNYGFNVANIQKFSLRFLDSGRVADVAYRRRDLLQRPFPRGSRIGRLARGYTLERLTAQQLTTVTPEWDALFDRVADDYRFLVRRDAAYVRWRYLESPGADYAVVAVRRWGRLVGWSVFRVREQRLIWGDALFDRQAIGAVGALLRHVAPLFAAGGVETLEGWFPPRPSWFATQLDRHGLEPALEPQSLALMVVPFTMPDAEQQLREQLYYTMGDSDLF